MKHIAIKAMSLAVFLMGATGCTFHQVIRGHSYDNAGKYEAGTIEYEGDLKTINLNWRCGKVTLIEDIAATSIKIEEDNALESRKKVHSYFNEGVLNVEFWDSGVISTVDYSDKEVTITFPYASKMNLVSSSAPIIAETLKGDMIDLTASSGMIKVNTLEAHASNIITSSGSVRIAKATVEDQLDIGTSSGSITLDDVKTTTLDLNTSSASVHIAKMDVKTTDINTSSGSVHTVVSGNGRYYINTSSGSVHLKMTDTGATLDWSTSSGGLHTDKVYSVVGGDKVFGEGAATMYVNTSSGSLYVD